MKKINAILTISRRTLKRNPMIPPVSRSIAIIPVGMIPFSVSISIPITSTRVTACLLILSIICSFIIRKRLLNYILCIRFFIEVHSIVSASRFFHMPTYLRVVIECQSRFFPFFPAFSRNCPDYFLHTSGSSSFRSLSDLGAR